MNATHESNNIAINKLVSGLAVAGLELAAWPAEAKSAPAAAQFRVVSWDNWWINPKFAGYWDFRPEAMQSSL